MQNSEILDLNTLYNDFQNPPKKGVIDCFDGEYQYLSNFSKHGFFDAYGQYWHTNEHYFQAMKGDNSPAAKTMVQTILKTPSPGKAKRLGRLINMRDDWDDIRVQVMAYGLLMKFNSNPDIKASLINTSGYTLIEGNTWNDLFWGVDIKTGTGKNHLGRLLMILRTEFISGHLKRAGLIKC